MSFKATASATAIVTLLLGLGYLLAGPVVVARWSIDPTPAVLLFGRRIGAIYLGLSTIFFLARTAMPSAIRNALCFGAVICCSLLGVVGIHARVTGTAGSGILVSIAIELFLAAAFLRILIVDRRSPTCP